MSTRCLECQQECDLFDVDVGGTDELVPPSCRQYVSHCCRVGYTTKMVEEGETV